MGGVGNLREGSGPFQAVRGTIGCGVDPSKPPSPEGASMATKG